MLSNILYGVFLSEKVTFSSVLICRLALE